MRVKSQGDTYFGNVMVFTKGFELVVKLINTFFMGFGSHFDDLPFELRKKYKHQNSESKESIGATTHSFALNGFESPLGFCLIITDNGFLWLLCSQCIGPTATFRSTFL